MARSDRHRTHAAPRRMSMRFTSRAQAVAELRARLERGSWPRAQMMLLVMLTGGAGFLASFALLASGMASMGLRYALACLVAYACFLALLGIWIHWRRDRDPDDGGGLDAGLDLLDLVDAPGAPGWQGGGGHSGGGGASATFDAPGSSPLQDLSRLASTPKQASGDGGLDFDLDAAAIPVLLALLVLALVLSSLFVVWSAPALFTELLLDGALATGLYRRLRHIETRHWLDTALRKTAGPFVVTAIVLALGGVALQGLVPQADSMGDVLVHLRQR